MRHIRTLALGLAIVSLTSVPDLAHAQGGWTDSGSTVHLTTNSDRVGIGTTAPAAKLHVNGSTRVEGNVVVERAVVVNIIRSAGAELRLRAGGMDALRLEGAEVSPNLIGGHFSNEVFAGAHGATIGGGGEAGTEFFARANVVTDNFGTVGGGRQNQAGDGAGTTGDAPDATVSGGFMNSATGENSTVGGGKNNLASGERSTVAGGEANRATELSDTVGGGLGNDATGSASTVGGGANNEATSLASTVAGGGGNSAGGQSSTVGGGRDNAATGDYSTVPGGRQGRATHAGAFVWADSTNLFFFSEADNQFRARSTGGAQFVSAVDGTTGAATAGVALAPGGGSWASISDRSVKENIASVDGGDILRRLSTISITRWNLKAQNPEIKHVGPMAQDFYAAFGLGEDERYINSADVDGIALVSIQALYQMVTALEEKTAAVDRKAAALDRKMADLERMAAGLEEVRARLTRFERAAEVR